MVLVDQGWMPHGDEIERKLDVATSDLVYVRLLGDRKKIEAITRRWSTEVLDREDRLQRWANLLVRTARRGLPTVVYVNNHYAGHTPSTTHRLKAMVETAARRSGGAAEPDPPTIP